MKIKQQVVTVEFNDNKKVEFRGIDKTKSSPVTVADGVLRIQQKDAVAIIPLTSFDIAITTLEEVEVEDE